MGWCWCDIRWLFLFAHSDHRLVVVVFCLCSQCSQTCGGGVQKQDTVCKQRLADGSMLELPETFCSMPRTVTQRTCKNEDCPNEWLLSDWTEVCYLYAWALCISSRVPKTVGLEEPNKVRLHKACFAQFCPVFCPYQPGWELAPCSSLVSASTDML